MYLEICPNHGRFSQLRLLTRSDVVGRWDIASTTFFHFYCKEKLRISAQCFTPPVSKSGRSYNRQLSDKVDSVPVVHTRTLLLSPEATWLAKSAFAALKKGHYTVYGCLKGIPWIAVKDFKLEAPLFVGVGEGTDNLDFLADLSALRVIEPEEVSKARPDSSKPVPRSESELLQKLKQGEVPYAHCAWCEEALPTRSMLEQHYYAIHHVVLQPSCCAPPSVFQTIMGKELQLRQQNFGSVLHSPYPASWRYETWAR